MREWLDSWFPTVLKWTGLLATIALALLWAVTALIDGPPGIVPPAVLVTAFGSMYGIGAGTEAIRELNHK